MLSQVQVYRKVNQLYIYIYPLFFRFFSHIGHYSILSRVPCVTQYVLISYQFYILQCVYVNLPIYPSLHLLAPGNHTFIFYICNSISVLQISSFVPFFFFFLDSTYKQYHMKFVFLCLTYFTQYDNLQVHSCCKIHHFKCTIQSL